MSQTRADEFERTPPHDIGAEQCVLGGMMLSRDAIKDVIGVIGAEHLFRPAHQMIFEAVVYLYGKRDKDTGQPVPTDAVAAAAELTRRGQLETAGGGPYLHTCIASVPTAANAGYYAREILRERAADRKLIEVGTRLVQFGYSGRNGDGGAAERVRRAQAELYQVVTLRDAIATTTLGDALPGALDEIEALGQGGGLAGVATGFTDLDLLFNGLLGGQVLVIAARPAVGKSTLGNGIARHAAIRERSGPDRKQRVASLVFTLEMSLTECVMRTLSAEARVPLHAMLGGRLTDDDWTKLARKIPDIADAPLHFCDTASMGMHDIETVSRDWAERMLSEGIHPGPIIIDYLQLVEGARRNMSEYERVSENSRLTKLLAKELDVPVILISQLNRGPEQRSDKRPQLSDLRASGSIEQDADNVILLHREDATERESPRAGEADFIVAKHRNGPTATITVAFQGHYSRFVDMAPG